MERKQYVQSKINEALESAKRITPVEPPAFFTERTMSRLHSSRQEKPDFSYTGILKIAAVVALLLVNVYTIRYALNNKQQDTAKTSAATIADFVNEYQPTDVNELTFEEKINK